MGGFKNMLIAEQVELGDREPIPEPIPASEHVAAKYHYTPRRLIRLREKVERIRTYPMTTGEMVGYGTSFFAIGLGVGILLGYHLA